LTFHHQRGHTRHCHGKQVHQWRQHWTSLQTQRATPLSDSLAVTVLSPHAADGAFTLDVITATTVHHLRRHHGEKRVGDHPRSPCKHFLFTLFQNSQTSILYSILIIQLTRSSPVRQRIVLSTDLGAPSRKSVFALLRRRLFQKIEFYVTI
jgi:hypothetical protein